MKEVRINRNFNYNLETESGELKVNKRFIIPNHLLEFFEGSPTSISDFINKKEIKDMVDYTGKKILVSRTGGLGDIFFIIRTIIEIRKRFDNVWVEFRTSPKYINSIKNLFPNLVNKVGSIIIPYPSYEASDYMITFEGVIEGGDIEASTINGFILMGKKFFIDIGMDHSIELTIPEKFKNQAEEISKTWNSPVIGIQVKATAILRTYPFPYQIELIRQLGNKGFKVLLLDEPHIVEMAYLQMPSDLYPYILKPYTENISSSFELACALASKCKVIVAPDSVFVYVGDAFKIPTIGIYSPFSSQLRASGLNVYALDVIGGCYNCTWHSAAPCKWSIDTWSPCLKKIRPKYIVALIDDILEGKK